MDLVHFGPMIVDIFPAITQERSSVMQLLAALLLEQAGFELSDLELELIYFDFILLPTSCSWFAVLTY